MKIKWLPLFISLRFLSNGRGFGLWIPIFILVPVALVFVLALFLIILPFLLLSLVFTWDLGWWRWLAFLVPAFFKTLHALPGLQVDLLAGKRKIYIAVH